MKKIPCDLAVLGGPRAFAEPLHVGRPNIGDEAVLLEQIADLLRTRRLTNNGPLTQSFEERLRPYCGSHCVAVANGTLGLMIAARALHLSGEVIVPSFTFVATAHALAWQGLTPVFCDIDPQTYQIDPSSVEAAITPRTSGIVGVHLFGRACDVDALEALAQRYRLRLLFDAAHVLGCSTGGAPIGDRGDASVFSFHATKILNTFEGGAIVTRDADLAEACARMRNHGFGDDGEVQGEGINAKLPEPSAAMGLVSLESLATFLDANRRNYDYYVRLLTGIPGITLLPFVERESNNWQYVVVEVDEKESGLSRDALMDVLQAENVLARRYFYPGCHRVQPYASLPRWSTVSLPNTERAAERVMCLPTGTAIGEREIEVTTNILKVAIAGSKKIRHGIAEAGA